MNRKPDLQQEKDATIVRFRKPDETAELARLRRLTGLSFEAIPRSLLRDEGAREECASLHWQAGPQQRPA